MTKARNVRDLERRTRRAADALTALLDPVHRGTVLSDLVYRAGNRAQPDGFPTSSRSAAPALMRPASQQALRTSETDALRRKREHGFAEGSSVENAVESLLDDVCDDCKADPEKIEKCRTCSGSGRRFHDPTYEAVEELIGALETVTRLCDRIDKKRQIVLNARDSADGPTTAENCRGCHRPRRLHNDGRPAEPFRRALCQACAQSYYLWRVDNGTDDEAGDRGRWCATVGPQRRHEGHLETTCDQCAEDRRKASDDWRLDVGHGMKGTQR